MDKLQLKAQQRDVKAVNPKKLRKTGMIPVVLYGHHVKNQALAVNTGEFEKVLRKAGESTIIDLLTDDGKIHPVLIHEVQNHFLTGAPDHVDFYEVSMTEKLKATVALEFEGESNAVKALGGVLVKVLNEIEVECLPADLPHNIVVDISVLKGFNDVITVQDLKVPAKVEVLSAPEEMVVKVQPPRDVEAELSANLAGDVAAVEGAAEDKPAAVGEAPAEAQTKE